MFRDFEHGRVAVVIWAGQKGFSHIHFLGMV